MTQEQRSFLEALYKENFRKLYYYGFAILKEQTITENLINDTFLVAVQKIDTLMTHENPAGWLICALKNHIKHYRYICAQSPQMIPLDQVEEYLHSDEELHFSDLEGTLTEKECAFFRIYYDLGCSHKAVAELLGISVSACYKRLERIRTKIKRNL